MQKNIFIFAALSALISNGLGAFGAHALKAKLPLNLMNAYQTGVQYQFYHSLGLLFIGILMFHISNAWIRLSCVTIATGILLFSGSLYILSITGIKEVGIVTPLGGLAFMAGWLFLLVGVIKEKNFNCTSNLNA